MARVKDTLTWLAIKRRTRAFRKLAETYELPGGYRRIYCHHVRKTGGTSLHRSFMALGGEDPAAVHDRLAATPGNRTVSNGLAFVAHSGELLEDGSYFYGWSHVPAHEIRLPPATFTVAILRDPAERVLSHYQMLLYGTRGAYPFPHSRQEGELAESGFEHFLDALPREELLRQLFMFSASFDVGEAAARLRGCSHLFLTEEYETGLAELAEMLLLPLTMRREREAARRAQLGVDDLRRLTALLEPEYDLLARLGLTGARAHEPVVSSQNETPGTSPGTPG